MVKQCFLILFAMLAAAARVSAGPTDVAAEIQQDGAYENQPLKGTITITHDNDVPVDINSFKMDREKISADFIKDVRIDPSNPTVLSIYGFQLPGKPRGLYALPPISVKIGGKTYNSIMSTYSVMANPNLQPSAQPSQSTQAPAAASSLQQTPAPAALSTGKPLLKLEAGVEGRTSLYPGQTTRFYYRYYFVGNIGLTKENIPMLDATGFVKIGEKEIKDTAQGDESVREISQVVQAVKPGTYTFGPSMIEGYAYKEDSLGNPVYTSAKLTSEVPAVEITVLPFPEKSKPASFNGAVGKFTFRTKLESSPKMNVDDTLSLALVISGKGNIKTVQAPDLCCQPGFSGFFVQSDLPPKETVTQDTKTTVVQLRVLSDKVKEIPSIEFSYFDPELSTYTTLRSKPIPIEVKAAPVPSQKPIQAPNASKETAPKPPPQSLSTAPPIEIESIMPLKANDLYNLPFGTWWTLLAFPLAAALLFFQSHLKDYIIWRRSVVSQKTSQELFSQAFNKGQCNFDILKQAFRLALIEAGLIKPEITEDDLPSEGLPGEVKALLDSFDEKRFGKNETPDPAQVRALSKALFAKIAASKEK